MHRLLIIIAILLTLPACAAASLTRYTRPPLAVPPARLAFDPPRPAVPDQLTGLRAPPLDLPPREPPRILLILAVLLLLGGLAAGYARRHDARRYDPRRRLRSRPVPRSLPPAAPPALPPAQGLLPAPAAAPVPPPATRSERLLQHRLQLIERVLRHPETVRPLVADPFLRERLAAGLHTNHDLYECVAVLLEAEDGTTFVNDPANTLARHLRRAFKRRGWTYPRSPYAWRRHFDAPLPQVPLRRS